MNIVKLIVFVDTPATEYQTKIIQNLDGYGYATLVDALNCNRAWFVKNMTGPHRLIQKDFVTSYTTSDWGPEDKGIKPQVAIYYNDDNPITEEEFFQVVKYFRVIFDGQEPDYVPEKFLEKPRVSKQELPPLEEVPKDKDYYDLRMQHVVDIDVMFYEVTKPFTDLPYTTYVKEFGTVGHLPFFTNLFVSKSWGVARKDIGFLQYLWKEFKMSGEFDIEKLVKDRVEKCTPGEGRYPEPEPEVYRRSLEEVLVTFQKKYVQRHVHFAE